MRGGGLIERLPGALVLRCAPSTVLARWAAADGRTAAERGRAGEELAARWLQRGGERLLARGVTTRWAEVDLVVRWDATLVVVEVKTGVRRPDAPWRPAHRLGAHQCARLSRAARGLARAARCPRWRVDRLEVSLESDGPRFERTQDVGRISEARMRPRDAPFLD